MENNRALKAIRLAAGLSQEEASQPFNIDRSTWAKWESGCNPIPDGFLAQVKDAFWPIIRQRADLYGTLVREEEKVLA